ncbi:MULTISPECIES: glycosyltransferase [unclassified Thiocapsa]|uniref:glycosyltransferase n=1 Tax=unclassified Thiocapsa TaxID=2641286 RepID=UPI0035B4C8A2
MRVALVTPYDTGLRAGGGAVIIRYLIAALEANGLDVALWLCRDTPSPIGITPLTGESGRHDWEIRGLPPQMAFSLARHAPQSFAALVGQARAMQVLRPVDAVIVFNAVTPGLWAMELAAALGVPYYLMLLDYSFLCPVFSRLHTSGVFCEGSISEAHCLSCAVARLPSAKRQVFRALRALPYPVTLALGRLLPALFPASGRHHVAGAGVRETRRVDLERYFSAAAGVIYQSRTMQAQVHAAGLQNAAETIACYGVPEPECHGKKVCADDTTVEFVYLSRPTSEWGLDLLLAVWAEHCTGYADRRLTVLSPGIDAWLEQHPQWRGLPNVVFSGETIQGQVAAFHSRFHVLILPAQWPGIVALTALEALAHGTAVIEPHLGGLADFVGPFAMGRGVMPYRYRDGRSLALCIDRLCADRAALAALMSYAQPICTLADWGKACRDLMFGPNPANRSTA